MAKKKGRKHLYFLGFLVFIIYVFAAARPVPEETILVPLWLISLESNNTVNFTINSREEGEIIPFRLGNRFGYIENNGQIILNRIQQEENLSFSPHIWSEYEALPSDIEVYNPYNHLLMTINNPLGYPLFLDNRAFLLGSEQSSLSALDSQGNILWTYDFPAPITCIDAASGFVLAGTLDGGVELLNDQGIQAFPSFEPGGSRLSVILGCAISSDASRLAVISGIDNQRFLLMEKSGETYRVIYHEYLSTGFRRAVHVRFIDNDSRVVFEREGGIGIYDTNSRNSVTVALEGEIKAMDTGEDGYFFVINSHGGNLMSLVGLRLPGTVVLNTPFRSENIFLDRQNSRLFLGGDLNLASFELGKQ